jgi:hypothetical protein
MLVTSGILLPLLQENNMALISNAVTVNLIIKMLLNSLTLQINKKNLNHKVKARLGCEV